MKLGVDMMGPNVYVKANHEVNAVVEGRGFELPNLPQIFDNLVSMATENGIKFAVTASQIGHDTLKSIFRR